MAVLRNVVDVCCIPTTTLTDFSVSQATFGAGGTSIRPREGADGSAGPNRINGPAPAASQRKRPQRWHAAALKRDLLIGTRSRYLSLSPLEDGGLDEVSPAECPHEGAGLDAAGLGAAQLGAAGGGVGAGLGAGAGAGFGAAIGAAGLGVGGLGAAGLAAGAAFFADAFLAPAFLADFFGAAAFDFLADFFADFLAFFADFFADFFEDFFADFFFAVTRLFLAFLAFLLFLLFFPLAIVILLLPPINV